MIIPAHVAHLPLITAGVSDIGRRELAEVYGMTPEESVRRNLAASSESWTMFAGADALAMFGVAPISLISRQGEFWIVSTTHICNHRLAFARMCRQFLPRLLRDWDEVLGVLEHNRADVVRWAEWLGVQITPRNDRLSEMRLCLKPLES